MFGALKRRLSRSISRAGELLAGPTPAKQFRNAIIDGDEDKAISLYTCEETTPKLSEELHPSKPFPTKKDHIADTPLFLAAKHALQKLTIMLLERGGDPSVLSARNETCIHAVCSLADHPEIRAQLLEIFYNWEGVDEEGKTMDKVSLNKVDIDGNTAIHYAASNGLVQCVERLVTLGAIISIVNKNNITCCEMADEANRKDLALMLELALVFQPEDLDLASFDRFAGTSYVNQSGRLYLDTPSLTQAGLMAFVEECITVVARHIAWMNARSYRSRAEQLLNLYAWDVEKLVLDYLTDSEKVLTQAKMVSPSSAMKSPITDNKEDSGEADHIEVAKRLEFAGKDKEEEEVAPQAEEDGGLLMDDIQIDTTDITSIVPSLPPPESKEDMICLICGEEMLPACDIEQYQRGQVTEVERRALSCLSGHTFCMTCWSSHLSVQMSDNAVGCIPCLAFKCGEMLDFEYGKILLKNQEEVAKLQAARLRHIVDYAGMKYCPVDSCGLVLAVPPAEVKSSPASSATAPVAATSRSLEHSLPTCALCANNHMICLQCSAIGHSPASCSDYLQWQKLVQEELKSTQENQVGDGTVNVDDIANALWVAANTKRCPRCGTAIEKDEGCNHMSCRKCRKEFCWICMQDWSLHSDNTGGYFQCNRFVEQSSGGGAVNGPSRSADGADPLMGRGDIWSEERGNAHAEAMRSRERNRRMARFIHHFTRYKAHGDSQAMEVRMHKETLRRIGEGLRACVDGQLKWLQGTLVPNPVLSASAKQMNANAVPSTPLNRFASQKIVAKDYQLPPCDPCIEFLHHGFEELHRCRSFLQFSYVYAYFEFMDNDDYDVATGRRRSFYARMRVDDHRSSFEMLQADLESTIEMLSDVCARRRLRASESQIAQATRAAKQKRVEFESLLIAYSISKQQAAQEESSASSSMSPFRSAPLSELRMRAMGRANNRRTPRYPPQATAAFETMLRRANRDRDRHNDINLETIEEGLDEYSMDELANLLLELELVHASQASQAAPAPTPQEVPVAAPSQPAENDQEPEIATPGQTRANNPSTIRERLNAVFAPASTGSGQERRADSVDSAGAGDSPSLEYSNSNEESDDSSDQENVVIVTPQQRRSQQQRQQQEERRLLRLARRAEEAADLNRAILMSLQAPATRPQSSSNAPPNEEHIGTLMAMGFSREDAEAALRRAGNSLEAAVNQLLG